MNVKRFVLWFFLSLFFIILLAAIFFFYTQNTSLTLKLQDLNSTYEKVNSQLHDTISEKNELQHTYDLLHDSLSDSRCEPVGARSGILSCIRKVGFGDTLFYSWKVCYDSLDDTNPGDKDDICCNSIGGFWDHGKCCTPDKNNACGNVTFS